MYTLTYTKYGKKGFELKEITYYYFIYVTAFLKLNLKLNCIIITDHFRLL